MTARHAYRILLPVMLLVPLIQGCSTGPDSDEPTPRLIVVDKSQVPEGARISQGQAIDIALEHARRNRLGTIPSDANAGHATYLRDAKGNRVWQVSYKSPPEVDWIITINALNGRVQKTLDLRKRKN